MRFGCCNKNMTPLQRRSIQRLAGIVSLTVFINFTTPNLSGPLTHLFPFLGRIPLQQGHPAVPVVAFVSALSVFPVIFAVWVIGRYLSAEPDEFIRTLVVRALLWGVAVTMAGDALVGVLMVLYSRPFPIGLLNADIFFVSTALAFRLTVRSYR